MRYLKVGLLLAGAALSTACFHFSTVMTVKADGSGTIDQRFLFTQAAVAQLRQFAAPGGASGQPFEPVPEQQARDAAAELGPGVTYVSSTPIDTPEGLGRDIKYAFTDVDKLTLDETPPGPGGVSVGASGGGQDQRVSFKLSHLTDGHALLTIALPPLPMLSGSAGSPAGITVPSADQMAMLKPMLAGARLSIAIEPGGPLVRTSSPYVDGQRVTIVAVDLDSVLSDPTLLPRLQAAKTPEDRKAILKNAPGMKVNLDPAITIEFR
jgi:hypothetical protein